MKWSRRDLLKLLGICASSQLSLDPRKEFERQFGLSLFNRANAGEAGEGPRRYVFIHTGGAPSRWTFDLMLNSQGNKKNFKPPVGVINHFDVTPTAIKPGYRETVIKDKNNKSVGVPHLWETVVNVPSRGSVPLKTLLDSAVSIRGIDMLAPAHAMASLLLQGPDGNSPSLSSLVADGHEKRIPAISMGPRVVNPRFPFVSQKGKNVIYSEPSANSLKREVMGAFNRTSGSNVERVSSKAGESIDQVIRDLSSVGGRDAILMMKEQEEARKLMDKEYQQFEKVWPGLVTKYQKIISSILTPTFVIKGVTDKSLEGLKGDAGHFQLQGVIAQNKDLRTVLHNQMNIPDLAGQFAMAEYMITRNLSSVARIYARHINSLNMETKTVEKDAEGKVVAEVYKGRKVGYRSDEHQVGRYISTIANSYYNTAMGACILELTGVLKGQTLANGKDLFEETVIQLNGEFNRSPKNKGEGSDHGYKAASTLLVCGALKGFQLVGDIYSEPPDKNTRNRYPGTWGYGAPLKYLSKQTATYGNLLSSVATVLRIPSPSPFRLSLLKDEGGEINVADESLKTPKIRKA